MDNNKQMQVSRRGFLKLSGAGLSGVLLQGSGEILASAPGEEDVAILYDASKCIGCKACERACKECNELPECTESFSPDLSADCWNLIKKRKGVDLADHPFFSYQCMHCTDAACVAVCPTGALHKDCCGFVAFDADKCNGCGYCTQFCPYGVPHLRDANLITGGAIAAKCTFCQSRLWEEIGGPACVEACPTGALIWGKREKLVDDAKIRVSELKVEGESGAMLYGEKEAGGLHRLSILLDEPSAYGLPADPQTPVTFSRIWQKIVQPLGTVAFGASLLGIMGAFLVTRRTIKMEEVE